MESSGFLVSAGVWVGSTGYPPRSAQLPLQRGRRPDTNHCPIAVADIPTTPASQLVPINRPPAPPPGPIPRRGIFAQREPVPFWLGDVDDTFLDAWRSKFIRPPAAALPTLRYVSTIPDLALIGSRQDWADLSDFATSIVAAGFSRDARPLPKIPAQRQHHEDRPQENAWFTDQIWFVTNSTSAPVPRLRVPPNRSSHDHAMDAWDDDVAFYPFESSAAKQHHRIPTRPRGAVSVMPELVLEDLFVFWFPVIARPPVPVAPRQRITDPAPPWLGCFSIVVPGPFWVAAGQVVPAAGAVAGDVMGAGED